MINAVIDLGNTFGKIGIFENDLLLNYERGIRIKSIISKLKKVKADNLIICSVTQSTDVLSQLLEGFKNGIILTPETPLPIINKYATPLTLGYDRLAAVVGAHFRYPESNCLVIDMGTAIKYDFITKEGEFIGGIISPGMQMRFKALHTFTKKLPLLQAESIPELIGNSTESCMRSGVVNGIIAEINGLIAEYHKNTDLKVLISGGDAAFFESRINYPKFAAPYLVAEGLNRILKYNVEKKLLP